MTSDKQKIDRATIGLLATLISVVGFFGVKGVEKLEAISEGVSGLRESTARTETKVESISKEIDKIDNRVRQLETK
jgi:hypothetical protein